MPKTWTVRAPSAPSARSALLWDYQQAVRALDRALASLRPFGVRDIRLGPIRTRNEWSASALLQAGERDFKGEYLRDASSGKLTLTRVSLSNRDPKPVNLTAALWILHLALVRIDAIKARAKAGGIRL